MVFDADVRKEADGCPLIRITGANYSGGYSSTRRACRGILTQGDRILLSYETVTDTWMIPGGGLEDGESWRECCIREVAEETGYVMEPSGCRLVIEEYYGDERFETRYYTGTVSGTAARSLTEREKEVGMEPRWIGTDRAAGIFSRHEEYSADEMKRGMYEREYTALKEIFRSGRQIMDT